MRSAPQTLIQQLGSLASSISALNGAGSWPSVVGTRPMWSMTKVSGSFLIVSMFGTMSAPPRCSTTCQPRPLMRSMTVLKTAMSGVPLVEIGVGKRVVDDGDAAIALRVRMQAIHHRAVVGAVAARLHDHRARDAEIVVQRAQHLLRSVGRRVAAVWRIGEAIARP